MNAKKKNGEITVERGIPVPKGRSTYNKYPFGDMRIGDSFEWGPTSGSAAALYQAASQYKRRHPPWNYITRTANGCIRLWRTA